MARGRSTVRLDVEIDSEEELAALEQALLRARAAELTEAAPRRPPGRRLRRRDDARLDDR
jgi:hypothetical protein